jgi:hypothetical protein
MESDNQITVETAERLREQFERIHRGADRAHRTAVLPQGVHWKDVQASNEASQFLETRAYQTVEICRAYRVDPSYVQDKTKVGYASQEQAAIDLVQQTLLPWFRRWESAITRDLVTQDDVYFAEFDTRGLLRGDLAAQGAWLQTMLTTGIYSVNECREVLNMNPIGPEGDQRYMQMNLTTMQGIAATAVVGNAVDSVIDAPSDSPLADTSFNSVDTVVEQGPQIADLSLNGAQVSSLIEIVAQYNAGLLTEMGAKAVISAAFPGIPASTVNAIIAGTNTNPVETPNLTGQRDQGPAPTVQAAPPPEDKAKPKRGSRKRG